jgi:hypothetical protein
MRQAMEEGRRITMPSGIGVIVFAHKETAAWEVMRHDIATVGHTVWVTNSQAARPEIVQAFSNKHGARYVVFVAKRRDKPGSQTSNKNAARYFSRNKSNWLPLPPGLSEVTGRINSATSGLWFDALRQVASGALNLDQFVKVQDSLALTGFSLKDSAYPVRRANPSQANGTYEILAVGHLASPFAVWLKE